jgi:ABC-type nitrate/sulfonate/bicarbonate transport system permease component
MLRTKNLYGIGGIVLFLAIWQICIATKFIEFEYLPSPILIFSTWVQLLKENQFWMEAGHTMFAALLGWSISSSTGILLGTFIGLYQVIKKYTSTTIELLRPLPGVAFAPVGLILYGFSLEMELMVICLPTLWPVLVNTIDSVKKRSKRHIEVAQVLHLSSWQTLTKITIPSISASIMVGVRISLSLAIVMAVVAEMIGNPAGLGYAIIREQQAMNPNKMFAYIFTVSLLGVLANWTFTSIANLFIPNSGIALNSGIQGH